MAGAVMESEWGLRDYAGGAKGVALCGSLLEHAHAFD